MNNYIIEHKIATLADCAVRKQDDNITPYSFSTEDISFEPWEFNFRDGWIDEAWLAKSEITASNFLEAVNILRRKLRKIIPRISLISQCFVQFHLEPFLIYKNDNEFAYFQYFRDDPAVPLMFMENEKKALEELLTDSHIPEEFYYYWNDAVNTVGYSPKLLVMCSAIESLVNKKGKKDYKKLEEILGKELKEILFGTKEKSQLGLRHRLVHGEYLNFPSDGIKNYVEEIHQKIVAYFNSKVFSESLIRDKVTNPQRHPWGNKSQRHGFIKKLIDTDTFDLKDVLINYDDHNEWKTRGKYDDNFDNKELYEKY